MSRSRRKTPITGITTARSEKRDKQILHRTMRRVAKMMLSHPDIKEIDIIFPVENEVRNLWSMAKDGKMYHSKVEKPDCESCQDKIKCLTDITYKHKNCKPFWAYEWYRRSMRK